MIPHRPQLRRTPARSGFTLIEVLVTMALMAVVVPVVMRGISVASNAASEARHTAEAAQLGEMMLNQVATSLASGEITSSGTSGDFGPEWPDYRYQVETLTDGEIGVITINLSVQWTGRGKQRSLLLSTMIVDPNSTATAVTPAT